MRRWSAVLAVPLLVLTATPPPAQAVAPPIVPVGVAAVGPVAPPGPTEQRTQCLTGAVLPGSRFDRRPNADAMLDFTTAWQFSRGAGQRVAVVDTGVAPSLRLPALQGGGDYVSNSDGLVDCDAHGTLIAGLIAAAPTPGDAFAGVAPDAAIVSIRQYSGAYAPKGGQGSPSSDPSAVSAGYGNTATLAMAITHAVDLGATVVNVSQSACAAAGSALDDALLGAAVRNAFERNVVVVAGAGDVDPNGRCTAQNETTDPNLPRVDGWSTVRTIASPAWFADYVLTVGAVGPDGGDADFSLHGPWVDVAAPGEGLTSLDPGGPGLADGLMDPAHGPVPIDGTGYATALVSGEVALVRSRFPEWSAAAVIERIERTAHTAGAGPNDAVGYGLIDPVAAVSAPLAGPAVDRFAPEPASPPGPTPGTNLGQAPTVLAVVGSCLMLAVITLVVRLAAVGRRRRHRLDYPDPRRIEVFHGR